MTDIEEPLVDLTRHLGLAHLAGRDSAFAGPGFDASNPPAWNQVRVLVVGAGGLGCELLHCLALSGFTNLEVIDMDTIDLSNLNRQFLFRQGDIGKPKADVAAAFITRRYPHVTVLPHFGKIQDKGDDWYRSFHIIIMGLDSITARLWLSNKMASLAEYGLGDDGKLALTSATPIIDGGTEGFRGSARHITFGKTACMHCSMYLYPPPLGVPMCTLENVPRVPEHCVLYVQQKTWEDEKPFGERLSADGSKMEPVPVDGDNADHILWIMERAQARQATFKIEGDINFQFTQGVVKNVIPAVGFTNALVAGMCTTEALKLAIGIAQPMNNYAFYDGGANGVASYVGFLDADPECPVCQPPKYAKVSKSDTVEQIVRAIIEQNDISLDGVRLTPAAEVVAQVSVRDTDGGRSAHVRVATPKSHPFHDATAAMFGGGRGLFQLLAEVAEGVDPATAYLDIDLSGGALKEKSVRCLVFFIDAQSS